MDAIIGKKKGMTQVFDEKGRQVPVTIVQTGPCVVVQRKTAERDGYEAVQLGFGEQKPHRVSKAETGHCKKANAAPQRVLREVRVSADEEIQVGDAVTAAIFEGVSHVDVIGVTKGRGFQGVVRRWGMSGGRKSHGSGMHRRTGSIGMCKEPSRVFKNKKMPGQMGNRPVTVQNLRVVAVRPEDNVILVEGALPGPNGNTVMVRKSIKKSVSV